MKLFTATLSIASISSAIHLSQIDYYEDELITDQAKAVAQEIFDSCDTNDDDICTEAEKNALVAPLNEVQDQIDELYDEIYDWDALKLEFEAGKADLYKANQIPADLEDIYHIISWAADETMDD